MARDQPGPSPQLVEPKPEPLLALFYLVYRLRIFAVHTIRKGYMSKRLISSPCSLFLLITFLCLAFLIYTSRSPLHSPPITSITMTSSSNPLAGWYTRTIPHSSPTTFTPTRSSLSFIVTHSAQADPDGFTLAFFHGQPNVAVDARGRVLEVADAADFEGIMKLAKDTLALPATGSFLNTWRIKQARTEQPIERLYVPSTESEVKVTSVQGYDGSQRELKGPVDGVTELPDTLWELVGLVLEARSGFERGQEDKDVIAKVKSVLDDTT